jgi:hypothetical protein
VSAENVTVVEVDGPNWGVGEGVQEMGASATETDDHHLLEGESVVEVVNAGAGKRLD